MTKSQYEEIMCMMPLEQNYVVCYDGGLCRKLFHTKGPTSTMYVYDAKDENQYLCEFVLLKTDILRIENNHGLLFYIPLERVVMIREED